MVYVMMIEDNNYINNIIKKNKKTADFEILTVNKDKSLGMEKVFSNIETLINYWLSNVKNNDITYINSDILDRIFRKNEKKGTIYISILSNGKIKHYIIKEKSDYKYLYSQKKNCIKSFSQYLKQNKISKANIYLAHDRINDEAVRESNILKLFISSDLKFYNIEPMSINNVLKRVIEKKISSGIVFSSYEASLMFVSVIKSITDYKVEELCYFDNKTLVIYNNEFEKV